MNGIVADRAGVTVPPGLCVSFQRYALAANAPLPAVLPSSLGALPAARGTAGEVLLPLAPGEAFWIGLDAAGSTPPAVFVFEVEVETPRARWTQAPVRVSRHAHLAGYATRDGRLHPFDIRCRRLAWTAHWEEGGARTCRVEVRLVDSVTFRRETGALPPGPLDPGAGYGGWRLP